MNDFFASANENPLPVEFAPDERRQLLEEIGFVCLLVNQGAGDKTLRLANSEHPNSLLAANSPFVRLQRLEQFIAQLLPLVLASSKQPDSVLISASRRLPLDRLRGNAAVLGEIVRSPQAQQTLLKPRHPFPLLSQAHAALSFDTPANRLLATLLQQCAAEANALASLAAFCADTNAEAQARQLETQIKRLLAEKLWRELKPVAPCQIASLLPVCHAKASLPYRLIFNYWQNYRTETLGFDWSGMAALTLSERALWQMYEIWCFLQLAQTVQNSGWKPLGDTQIRVTAEGMHLVPVAGQASCLSFLPPNAARKSKDSMLRLFYQPLLVSANRTLSPDIPGDERYVSRSHAMQPDFVINYRGRLIVFDAKLRSYSTLGAEQEDIDKMHAYRDGIVRRAGQGLRSAVSAAWCLFPGLRDATPLSGIRAYPAPTESAPFGNGDIGAIRLRPLDTASQEILQKFLNHNGLNPVAG